MEGESSRYELKFVFEDLIFLVSVLLRTSVGTSLETVVFGSGPDAKYGRLVSSDFNPLLLDTAYVKRFIV